MHFLKDNWPWMQWLLYAAGGLGLFGWYFASIKAVLAAGGIVCCIVAAGVIYHKGEAAEHARVLAATKAAHAKAIEKMEQQKKIDDAELAKLKEIVDNTPPSSVVALKADRVKRIWAVR